VKPNTDDAINLAIRVEQALDGKYHVGITGSQLYGSRPGHEATFKDIDLIVYPGTAGYLDQLPLVLLLQKAGLQFVNYAKHADYSGSQLGPLLPIGSKGENRQCWIMDYEGTRVDVLLKQ
jgi:hypothetical protein